MLVLVTASISHAITALYFRKAKSQLRKSIIQGGHNELE
jgi:hypothetical protein